MGYAFHPRAEDFALRDRQARSWAAFVGAGRPSLEKLGTLEGWEPAFRGEDGDLDVFVIGGPYEGLSPVDGPEATAALRVQKLRERCAFINSPEVVQQLRY